jgi:ubiquinone/menaquinone biosynthesis C-methylase UbiE
LEKRKKGAMEQIRKPYQGVWNIIRFNWHFYLLSITFLLTLFLLNHYLPKPFYSISNILFVLIILISSISLAVSAYVYDFSDLYRLTWLDTLPFGKNNEIININAGFDEISPLLKEKYNGTNLIALDFYDTLKHTEVSIKRARKAYPPFPNTQKVNTAHLPVKDNSADIIFVILSAHEIRDSQDRIIFFKELNRLLKFTGKIVVTEHLRDTANFLAYNLGFFHFYSKASWLRTFHSSGLIIEKEIKITPFITTFILKKHGVPS